MSLKLILGPSGCGKSRRLFETALEDAAQNPGRQHIILVPEQFTMQTQQSLCSLSQSGGILNIDILSFSRLKNASEGDRKNSAAPPDRGQGGSRSFSSFGGGRPSGCPRGTEEHPLGNGSV